MALFMPTNITPSTLGALGNGTVDAARDMTVTWQVDGQNAMTAFEIKIYANTPDSTQLYDTGKKTDGCPFYGRDAGGDVVFFSYTIPASALAAAGIANGNSYKLLITQWWTGSASVTQQSASVFICRSAPTLVINSFSRPVTGKQMTWTASYAQAQGDPLIWVRWQLAAAGSTDDPLYDTGNIATAQLQFSYDGLFAGQQYAVRCRVETSNGVTADTGWVQFEVQYDTISYSGAVETCVKRRQSGVLVSWPGAYDIPGTASGNYRVRNGKLDLPAGANVTWDTVTGASMAISPAWSAVWRGTVTAFPTGLFSLGAADGQTVAVSVSRTALTVTQGGAEVSRISASFVPGDDITVVLRGGKLYVRRRYETGLFPSQSLYAANDLFPVRSQYRIATYAADMQMTETTVTSVQLTGAQTCDYMWIEGGELPDATLSRLMSAAGYTPEFVGDTRFLADFSEDLRGGNVAADEAITGWSVYRRAQDAAALVHVADTGYEERSVIDCGAVSQETYVYYIFGRSASSFATTALASQPVTVCLWDWTILVCAEEKDGAFQVEDIFRFSLNVESGTISNNNKPSLLENFTRYPTVQMSSQLYRSGTLSGYLGEVDQNAEYHDSAARMEQLMALSLTRQTLFLKNRKGSLMRIFLNGEITAQTQDATRQQALICAVPWCETGNARDAQLLIRQGSALRAAM